MATDPPQDKERFPLIDQTRGLAVLLMIIFHFSYDLALFGWVKIDFQQDLFWWSFPRVIVFLFLFSMGLATPLDHKDKINWARFTKRIQKLVLFAALISLGSYFMFKSRWIYFGTLHCIAVASLVILPFRNRPKLSLILGSAIILPSVIFKINIPWFVMPHKSMDYIPLFPWIGVVMWGVFASHNRFHYFRFQDHFLLKFLEKLGKHSLIIYILHQPIMYSIFYGIFLYRNS